MLTERRRLIRLALLLMILTLGVIGLASIMPPRREVASMETQKNPNRPQVEALPVSLRVRGFDPKEIVRPAGNYYLSVNNLSGVKDLDLRIERENGERVHESKTSREKSYWREQIHLSPGTYLLTEAGHPNWVCRITVTAK